MSLFATWHLSSFSRIRGNTLLIGATISTILIFVPTINLFRQKRVYRKQITSHISIIPESRSETRSGNASIEILANSTATKDNILPSEIVEHPENYRIFFDSSSRSIPSTSLPDMSSRELLTTYLQHNMTLFSKSLTGRFLYLFTISTKRYSFDEEYLQKLKYEEGDLVNGLYTVIFRSEGVCPFDMRVGEVEGRLIISIKGDNKEIGQGKNSKFGTETWMWVPKDSKASMPMERPVPRWLHSLNSQRLIVEGTNYLMSLSAV